MAQNTQELITRKKAFSVAEVAEQISCSLAFVRKEIQRGKVKAKLVGRKVVILSDALDEYLRNRPDWEPGEAPEAAIAANAAIAAKRRNERAAAA